jgi:hypothetical protein
MRIVAEVSLRPRAQQIIEAIRTKKSEEAAA